VSRDARTGEGPARSRVGEGGRRERGREGKLTLGLDDWRQQLTEIPPRAREGGGRWERGKLLREKGKMKGRGVGARAWGGKGCAWAGSGWAASRAGPTTHSSHSLTSNQI
jgi:hypothetical protein